jgi:hypothetical protein
VERVADVVAILHVSRLVLVERLDELNAHIHEVTFTMTNGAVLPPELPGEVLFRHQRARQWQILVRTDAEDCVSVLRGNPCVQNIEARTPSLEEIFVAYMQRGRNPSAEQAVKENTKP